MLTPKVTVATFDQEALADHIKHLLESDSDAEMRWNAFIVIQKHGMPEGAREPSQQPVDVLAAFYLEFYFAVSSHVGSHSGAIAESSRNP